MWVAYVLATNPGVQARLKSEVNEFCSGKPRDWDPTYEEVEHLSYLNNFLRETLRYYSPGALQSLRQFLTGFADIYDLPGIFLPREAAEDVTVCGVFVPKGTQVTLCPAVAHFNTAFWGPDAHVYDPDRWSDGRAAKDSYAMEAFLQGPSGCIAKNMALLNIKSVIIALVRNFTFSPQPGYDGTIELANPNFTLRPKDTLRVVIERDETMII